MPFCPCPTGCGFYLSPNDRHDRCVQCLGRKHAEAAFAEGGCQNCDDMPLGTLRSRAAFFSKKPRRHSTASRSGPSTSGYEAAAMCIEEERQDLNDALPGTSSQTVHPVCPPMESQDDFESSSQYGLDLLFGAPAEEKAGSVASEGEPSEADVTAKLTAPAGESQSVADAEMAAALKRAAKEIGVVWVPPPSPEPSRLDDWFLGSGRDSRPRSSPVPFFPEVHEELTKSWKAPLSARSRHVISPSLTTLDGGPARGYTEVPQVERAIVMHLCPQNAASWRGRPRLLSRGCKFSSTLVAKAYVASGQAASALHTMAILQVYQAKVLKDLHEGVPDPELLHELRSATDYALRATKVTAQALGRAMSTMVVQERHLWLNLAEMRDAEKARFLDAPISQTGLFGETVEEFAQQFSTRALAQLSRRSNLRLSPAEEDPLRGWLRPRNLPVLQPDPPNGPALAGRWHRQPVLRPLRTHVRLRSVPETGSPGKEDHLTCPDPHSTRGRALDSASTRLSATRQTATTWSMKEQFPSSLGTIYSTSDPLLDGRMLFPLSETYGRTTPVPPYALKQQARSDDLPSRADHLHSSHGSDSLGRAASVVRGFSPPATHCFPSDGTPTLGTPNVTPLRPLAENFSDWLNLPNPSRWLLRTIRLGYAIQFARRPPKFHGVLTTSVQGPNTAVLRAEIAVLLVKDAIETVPSAEMKKGFYSPYFIVPKKGGGLRPILDLRVLNRALLKLPFKMLTLKHILTCVRVQDWFVAIDLKDAYFHVSILPRHRPFLRFAFEGQAYQYKVLPFGLSLSPRVFTKGKGHTHSQLSRRLADPSSLVGFGLRTQGHGSQPFGSVGASGQLGKEQTLPGTEDLFSRCRAGLGQYVCTSLPGACTVSSEVCGNTQMRVSGPPKTGSEAPRAHGILSRGHATGFDAHETAAALASYSSPQVGVASRHISSEHHTIVSPDTQPLDRHYVPTVRSSPGTGVQTHHCHHRCFQDRLGCHLQRAGSFRGLDRPPTVLAHKLSGVVGSAPGPEEVPTYDSGQARVGQVRQHCDCGLHQPPGWCTLLSHVTTSPPPAALESTQTQVFTSHSHSGRSQSYGRFPVTTGFARRRVETPPPVGPTDLGSIRPGTGRPLCLTGIHPLPAVVRSNRGPPRYRRTGTQLAEGPAQVCVSPSEPHRTNLVRSQGGQGTDSLGGPLLAQQNLVLGPGAPGISPSLAHSSEEGPPFSGEGHNLAPAPRSLEPPPLVPGRDQEDFRDLSPSVVNTLLQARAPSTRRLYDLKWRIFVNWCSSHGKDPRNCGIKSVLPFLQEGLDRHLSASTLKVHVAAISANHDLVGGRSVGKHHLIIRFLRGARRLNPPRSHLIPSWDLAVVLQGLQQDPFEPLQDQVVTLQALSSQEDDPNLTLLCPIRALRIYMERTQPFRRSEQLFVCYGGQQKGKAVSKQRISHWLVNAIRMAYLARGLPCPLEVRAHSTRGIAASAALANGASLTDICRAAGWATPNTFARFYNLRTEPVSARVLIANS
ncbi:hypothetical protein M9458_055622 [Cirrhinus mrigala]|uniref:ribonuclease H n=1 Tax=Cirrhinus mrigala TaxID=683832 RepID=A0ABD0MJS4_CIRMR